MIQYLNRTVSRARILSAVLGAAVVGLVAVPAEAASTNNILVIQADDVGVDSLSFYGEGGSCSGGGTTLCQTNQDCPQGQTCQLSYAVTPTLNGLAAGGLLFRNAWAAPTCSPTRATLIAGRYGFRTGVLSPGHTLQANELTIPEVLGAGWSTAAIGKWHLGLGVNGPTIQGFDYFAGTMANIGSYFSWPEVVNGSGPTTVTVYATTHQVNRTLTWIAGATQPWFVYLNFNASHSPFQVPPHNLLSPATVAALQSAPENTSCVSNGLPARLCHLAAIEAMDTELARLFAGLPPKTTIIFSGDNGTDGPVIAPPYQSSHAKFSLYEQGINVPLLIKGPGVKQGQVHALVNTADIYNTVIERAGATVPTDRAIDGVSLVPYFSNPLLDSLRTFAFSQRPGEQTIRNKKHKLIRKSGHEELYDLTVDDPLELNDLLKGTCSITLGTCHDDADCPAGETCVVPPLFPAAQLALDSLREQLDDLLASCDPLDCQDGATCTIDTCIDNECVHLDDCPPAQQCDPGQNHCAAECYSNADCNDYDMCTQDLCLIEPQFPPVTIPGFCRNIPISGCQ